MAERIEEPEAEVEAGSEPISPAAALAIGLRKGRSRERPDPRFERFLDHQTRLIDLQTEHLHEQREVIMARLKLGRWRDRITLALQAMTVLVGLAIGAAVALMAWQAHEDHGVVIEAFSVPPDLAARGQSGQAVARQLLDKLAALQAATVTQRPASSYANDWGSDIKVEIPETGVSIDELRRFLREELGSQTHITGEIAHTPTGLVVTARASGAASRTISGPEADLDGLVQKTAEAIYGETQPYRYAVYLYSTGRQDEAIAAYAKLAESGGTADRAWALNGLATALMARGDGPGAEAKAREAVQADPHLWLSYSLLYQAQEMQGHGEATYQTAVRYARLIRAGDGELSPASRRALRFLAPAFVYQFKGDNQAAADDYRRALGRGTWRTTHEGFSAPEFLYITAAAYMAAHDLAGSRRILETDPDAAGEARSLQVTVTRLAELEDWRGFAAALEAIATQMEKASPTGGASLERQAWPELAAAYVRLGRVKEAEALASKTPLDCDNCVAVRGFVAYAKGDRAAADRWFAQAARMTPSLPSVHTGWAKVLLDGGEPDRAIAEAGEASKRGPRNPDPLEIWGEALTRKADYAGAVAKFTEADRYAPHWGKNHLHWGEALMLAGRYSEARAQYQTANGLDLSKPDRAALDVLLARTASGPLHG